MPRRALLWIPLLLFVAVAALALWRLKTPRDDFVHSALVGQQVPAFDLPPALPGKPRLTAAVLRDGKPHLLNIFASWCLPCRAEAPQLAALKAQGVDIVGVAINDRPADLARFLNQAGDPFSAIGADRTGAVQLALGSSGVPESYLIASDGTILEQHIGEIRGDDVAGIVARLRNGR